MAEMTDNEFLFYCETHCLSPRAAFVPANLSRLCRLAGYEEVANSWGQQPNQILDGYRDSVLELVAKAKARLAV